LVSKLKVCSWPIPQPKHVPKPNTYPAIKNPFYNFVVMSASMTLEERFKALMKNCESMCQRRKEIRSSPSSNTSQSAQEEGDENEPHSSGFSSREEPLRCIRRGRRHQPNLNDIRVKVLEFEGKLDPDEFFEWLQTVERVFEFKDILEDKKVKLVALKLMKYASFCWTNLLTKQARQGKRKIRT